MTTEEKIKIAFYHAVCQHVGAQMALGIPLTSEGVGAMERDVQAKMTQLLKYAEDIEFPEYSLQSVDEVLAVL